VQHQKPNFRRNFQLVLRVLIAALVVTVAAAIATSTASASGETASIRIINGAQVSNTRLAQQWPFILSLGYAGYTAQSSHKCGASLLSPRLAVTAAHCVFEYHPVTNKLYRSRPNTLTVLSGVRALSNSTGQRVRVQDIIIHPMYGTTPFRYDIAVLRLAAPLTMTSTTSPISIVQLGEDAIWGNGNGAAATDSLGPWAAGWGNTRAYDSSPESANYPDTLREVKLSIADDDACSSHTAPGMNDVALGGSNFYRDTMMCAGTPDPDRDSSNGSQGTDTCQGDSGGPLIASADGANWRLVGLVSWGGACGGRFYGAYTRLAALRNWVASIGEDSGGVDGMQAPDSVSATALDSTSASITITPPSTGPTPGSYAAFIDVADVRVSGYGLATLGLRPAAVNASTTFTVTGLRPGRLNTIYVGSRDASRNISPFTGVNVTMPADTIRPSTPTRVRHRSVRHSHARVFWRASVDNDQVAVYQVWMKAGSKGWKQVATAEGANTGVTVHKLKSGTKYRVRVRAKDRSGNVSGWSRIDTFTTKR
jgi:secreted trypsin-like serine protease